MSHKFTHYVLRITYYVLLNQVSRFTFPKGFSMDRAFAAKHIVLGVSGGIAAYKVVDLASKLTQAGALVDVIMTDAAQQFVTPLTFAAITHRKVRSNLWEDWLGEDTGHVALAHDAA